MAQRSAYHRLHVLLIWCLMEQVMRATLKAAETRVPGWDKAISLSQIERITATGKYAISLVMVCGMSVLKARIGSRLRL